MRYEVVREFQDRGIAWLLRSEEHVLSLLRMAVPDLARAVDPTSLREEPTNLISATMARVNEDVIWRGALRAGVPFRALIAHQSAPDRGIARRLHQAIVHLEGHDARRSSRRLVPCVPIIIHTGARAWTPPRLSALYASHARLSRFTHDLAVVTLDLAARAAPPLGDEPLGWLLLLWRAQFAGAAAFCDTLRRTLDGLRRAARGARYLEAAWFCLQLVVNRRPLKERAMLRRVIDDHLPARESNAMWKTIAEHWQEKFSAEGKAEGKAEAILDVLEARFGRVPKSIQTAVRGVRSGATLRRLIARAATVERLADFKVPAPRSRAR